MRKTNLITKRVHLRSGSNGARDTDGYGFEHGRAELAAHHLGIPDVSDRSKDPSVRRCAADPRSMLLSQLWEANEKVSVVLDGLKKDDGVRVVKTFEQRIEHVAGRDGQFHCCSAHTGCR